MHFRKSVGWIGIGISLIFLFFACSASLYVPTRSDAEHVKTTLDTLMAGRKLYIYNCGGCHNLYSPQEYTEKEWVAVLPKMRKKAELTDKQRILIQYFVVSRCKASQ